ncbi:MAG: right-handed parallel beta-helix repeat-containing protein, partial [Candidatus Bipolaricaulia bacterium]
QDAINASPDGATIEVGPGTYIENLFIFHDLKLIGAGLEKTEIRGLSKIPGRNVILVYGGFVEYPIKVTIEGFTIRGVPEEVDAIWMERVFNLSFRNNRIIEGNFFLQHAVWAEIEGNSLHSAYIGVQDSSLVSIKGNTIIQGGIDIRYSSEVEIHDNVIQNNRFVGINLTDLTQSSVIGNTVTDGHEGISVMTFEGTISDNIVRNNSWNGIGLHLRTKATINSNIIEMNGQSGIQVWDETVRASFEANTIRNNQRYGIWVESLENVIVCRLNRVEGNEMGDYAVGPCYPLPPPSEELRQMCEGGG